MWILSQILRWVLVAFGVFMLVGCIISIYMNSDENYWRDVIEGLVFGGVIIGVTILFYI